MSKKKKPSAEQRSLSLKEQLLAEELVVSDDLVQSIVDDVGVPLDQSTIDEILQVHRKQGRMYPRAIHRVTVM